MDKNPAKSAPTPSKSSDAAFAEAKANFEGALAKTKAEAGEAEPEAIREESRVEPAEPARPEPKAKRAGSDELRALKAELAEMKRQMATPKVEKRAEPEVDEDFEVVQAELVDQFGEDEGKALGRALKAIVEPKERRLAQIERLLEDGMKRGRKQIATSNRSRLAETYSNLKGEDGDEAWEIVKERVEGILRSDPDRYDSPEDAYEATAQALFGKPRTELPSAEDVEEASRIAASQPTQPGRTKQERKLTQDQKARAVFDHLRKNPDDVAGARRISQQNTKG